MNNYKTITDKKSIPATGATAFLYHVSISTPIKLIPDISAAAFKNKSTKTLAMWYCLRFLNYTGSGVIPLSKAIEGLADLFHYSPETAYRHIQQGNGTHWQLVDNKRGSRIQIYALKTVCEYYSIGRITNKHFREIELWQFNTPLKRKSQIYASIHKPQGISGKPISRAAIEDMTGLAKQQQRRYEITAQVKRTPNYAMQQDNNPLGGEGYKSIKIEIFTKAKGHRLVNKRLGNSYHTQQLPGSKGMLSKVSKSLGNRSLVLGEASTPLKRFFKSFLKLSKHLLRGTTTAKEGYYLISKGKRIIKGRVEWCLCTI